MRRGIAVLLGAMVLAAPATTRAQEGQDLRDRSDPAAFWRSLGDSTLQRLVGQALEANHDLRVVEARESEARATRVEAALDVAPTLTLSAGYNRQRLSSSSFPGAVGSFPDQDVWDAGLHMSWELDVFGRLRGVLRGRNALVTSSEEDVRDVRVSLSAEVARTYFDLRGAHDRLEVAGRNAENQQRTLELTRDRLELGRGNALDVERAQAQLSSTLAIIPALEAEISALEHRLSVLTGQPPGSEGTLGRVDTRKLPLPPDLPVVDARAVVLERPDVRSAERRLTAQGAFVSAAKADYMPRISIEAVAGYTANEFDALGNTGTPRYAIGPVVSWPFLDLGRVKSRVDAAEAIESATRERYEQTVLNALEELGSARTSYVGARERLVHLEEAAAASERATELARLRFEEGATDFLEVLDTERRLLEAQDRLAAGHTEATNRLVAVYRALGGRWETTN